MKDPQFYSNMDLVASFSISLIISILITPFIKFMAVRLNYLDHPNGKKVHAHSTPLLGGLAIFLSFVISIIFTLPIEKEIIAIFLGSLVLIIIGLIDDKFGMMPTTKLFGQLIAALTIVKFGGIKAEFISNYYLSIIFTCFWVIGITNAVNLLDNMNGLSSGLVAIASIFFAVIAFLQNNIMAASMSLALCGACLGFLRYNFPNASIFMGDVGSLFIGFCVACIAMLTSWQGGKFNLVSLVTPIIILAYPIFDTALVSILRVKEKRSIFQGGRDHSSHRISVVGFKRKNTVIVIYLITAGLGVLALILRKLEFFYQLALIVLLLIAIAALGILLSRVNVGYLKGSKNASKKI